MATGEGGVTTNLPPTGGTSTSSVEGARPLVSDLAHRKVVIGPNYLAR